MGGGTALVGRARELSRARSALRDPDAAGVVVGGGAGIGKTRLALEIVRLGEDEGYSVARALATQAAASVPLGALAPLLPPLGRAREVNVDALGAAVRALAPGEPGARTLLLVDDAHLLDDASAAVVHQAAISAGVFVVATMRAREPVPDAIETLGDDDRMARIDLGPLSRGAVEQHVTDLLGGTVAGGTVHQLWELSGGNPLFLRELVLGGREEGLFVQDAGMWRLTDKPRSSPRLANLIEARLAGLDDDERATLELVALGEPVGLDLLADGPRRASMDALQRRGLVEVVMDGRRREVRLAHPLHGEVLRQGMPALRSMAAQRRLHEDVAAAGARRREDVPRVAMWMLEGGGPVDANLLLEAARRAHYANDLILAERLASVAVQAGGGAAALQVRGEVLAAQGRHDQAALALTEAAPQAADDRERALVAMTHSVLLFLGLDRSDDARAVLEAAEAEVSDPAWRHEMVAQRATYELLEGRPAEALAMVEPMLEGADGRAFVEAAIAAAPALAILGRGKEACALADRAFAAHLEIGDQEMMGQAGVHIVSKCVALVEMGELREADELARFGYDAALGASATDGQAWFSLALGRALWLRRPREALRWFREAAALFGSIGHDGARRWGLAGGAFASSTVGEPSTADELMREADRLDHTAVKMMAPDVTRARAWTAVAAGELGVARKCLEDACDIAAEQQVPALEVAALHDRVRLGDACSVAEHMEDVASRVDGRLAGLRVEHAHALAAGDPAALGTAVDGFEEVGATVLAAEAAAQVASLHRTNGSGRTAARWAQRASTLADEADGVATPAMALAGDAAQLTARELETARSAARGHRNKEIARELGVSVRTVENHLQRAYEKLGVAGREDLGAVLARNA